MYGKTSKSGAVPGICLMPMVMLWASSLAFRKALVNSCEFVKVVWYAMNREAENRKRIGKKRVIKYNNFNGSFYHKSLRVTNETLILIPIHTILNTKCIALKVMLLHTCSDFT